MGRRGYQTFRIRRLTTRGLLCHLHIWIKISLDLFHTHLSRYPGIITPSGRRNMSNFISSITRHRCNPTECQVQELPKGAGGLGIVNPCTKASVSYEASKRISAPLARQIIAQKCQIPDKDKVKKVKSDVKRENHTNIKQKLKGLFETVSPSLRRAMELSQKRVRQIGLT